MYLKENKPIRIVHFVSSISKSSGVMGVIMNYYRNIDTSKIQFDFIYFKTFENNYHQEISELGGRTYLVSSPKRLLKFQNDMNNIFSFYEYRIIHNHEVYLNGILSYIIKNKNIKIISHSHNTELSDRRISKLRNKILCHNINKTADIRLSCSEKAGESLYGVNTNFEVIYNAVDTNEFEFNQQKRQKMKEKLSIEDRVIIGHIGRYNHQKNHMFLIDIFKELNKKNPNALLLLIGEGPLKEEVLKKIEYLNLTESVIMLDFQNNISDYLQVMDIFVLPSLYEGLPVVGVEAQANSLPCVFSDNITREVGLLYETEFLSLKLNANTWADKINNMLGDISYTLKRQESRKEHIINKDFDIVDSTRKLEYIYTGL